MKYLFAAAGIIVLIAAGAYLWFTFANEKQKPIGDVTATIRYTDDGYIPHEVTINAGETVRWVNESSGEMWPASAVHPTHSIYPEKSDADCLGSSFDACAKLPPSATWEFIFTKSGDWKFHDHVRSSRTGEVHVK